MNRNENKRVQRKSRTAALVVLIGLLAPTLLPAQGQRRTASIVNVIVRVNAVTQRVDPAQPWTIPTIHETTGTGFLVPGNRILTDIELVRGATSITVTAAAGGRSHPARLRFQAFDAGIAVLQAEGSFFNEQRATIPVTGQAPAVGGRTALYGFENQGNLAVRQLRPRLFQPGLIENSDIDRHPLLYFQDLGGLELDGYSGGPALQNGKLIGMFHAGKTRTDRDTYLIPNEVIQHVLTDIGDGRYDGFPLPVFSYSKLRNLDQRAYLGLEGNLGGIVIDRLAFQGIVQDGLRPGDVIYQLNVNPEDARQWFPINAAGQVITGPAAAQRTEIHQFLNRLQAGRVKVRALRGGKKIERGLLLSRNSLFDLRRKRVFSERKYFLGAGLVFQELDYEIIHELKAPTAAAEERLRYRYYYYQRDLLSEQTDRDIVLTGVLSDPINGGTGKYMYGVIETINGRRVRTLRDFAREWRLNQSRYISIKFEGDPVPLTIEAEYLERAERRIADSFPLQEAGRIR